MRNASLIIPAIVGFASLAAAQTETSTPAATLSPTPAAPTPTLAASPAAAGADSKAADGAINSKTTNAAMDTAGAVSEKPAVLDAGLRTFAGPCIIDPVGKEQQALPLLGAALAGFIPQIASAAVDGLTNALDKAGQDQVVSITAVLPLENRPRCVQVTRGVTISSSQVMNTDGAAGVQELQDAIRNAPFLVEFLIRTSRDGTAISVMPTVMRYGKSLDGKHTGGRARDMYATLTFSNVGSSDTAQVSVPLGSYKPDPVAAPHYFDPVSEPNNPVAFYPAGAAASPWIKSPYIVGTDVSVEASDAGGSGTVAARTAVTATPTTAKPPAAAATGDTAGGRAASPNQNSRRAGDGYGGTTTIPKPVGSRTVTTTKASTTSVAATPGVRVAPVKTIRVGDEIKPITISITFRETKPGSVFARALSGILKDNKTALVDVVDPAKEGAARAADLAAWQTNQTAYATALGDYYKKRVIYCTGAKTSDDLKDRESDGAEMLGSEITLIAAGRTAGVPDLPFNRTVDPGRPDIFYSCGVTP